MKPFLRRTVQGMVLLLTLLLGACVPFQLNDLLPEAGPGATPTPTQMIAGGDVAYGRLRYTYTIDQGEAYSMSIIQEIPFTLWVDVAHPRQEVILTGEAQGLETVTTMGLDQGSPCTVTSVYTVDLTVTGDFTPQDGCRIALSVSGATALDRISTTTTCSALPPEFDPVILFITPHKGPFEFVSPYPTITQHPFSNENTVVVEILEVRTPAGTGCSYP